ncbi:hypothetical protein Peur_033413 [Populus x canadensis]|uniref:protein MIZU-KUSSEI 1-like n=1 Tax=Populus nigra TaxID=3691 RepID=UPI002B27159F|nr:protein MIZU-KUSSEI 1-like [Populus nigra]
MKHQQISLERNSSCSRSTGKIIPSNYMRSIPEQEDHHSQISLRRLNNTKINSRFTCFFSSIFKILSFPNILFPTACKWLSIPTQNLSITPSLGRKVTGTIFGNRHGHVNFAVQDDPVSEPVLLLELPMSTAMLVKEMSSGLVRIALECDKVRAPQVQTGRQGKLFNEPTWTMYCNGRKCGYAVSRRCTYSDQYVFGTVKSVSAGAGVIPVMEDGRKSDGVDGELMYMRAKFERVVGSRDSEAYYMMNPEGNGVPELSIFLLRI